MQNPKNKLTVDGVENKQKNQIIQNEQIYCVLIS